MIKIYIAEIPSVYDEGFFQAYCKKVDQERLKRVLPIRPEQSRMGSLLAGVCLQWGVKDILGEKGEGPIPLEYRYGEYGKPYLVNYPDIYFNLSHSGCFAACGVAHKEIGVDIQEERAVGDRLAKRFFTLPEYEKLQAIYDLEERQKLFFRLWAVKESYIKLSGRGMGQGLNTFRIDLGKGTIDDFVNEQQAWFGEWEAEDKVHLAVCGYEPVKIVKNPIIKF